MQDREKAIKDQSPAIQTHRMKEEKGKTVGDERERAAWPIKRHWPYS